MKIQKNFQKIIRETEDGNFFEVILKFDNFSDCKSFVARVSGDYDREYLSGINFIVKNGFYVVMFFDTDEMKLSDLRSYILEIAKKIFNARVIVTKNDLYWVNELLRQSEFSILGSADSVLKHFPDNWRL